MSVAVIVLQGFLILAFVFQFARITSFFYVRKERNILDLVRSHLQNYEHGGDSILNEANDSDIALPEALDSSKPMASLQDADNILYTAVHASPIANLTGSDAWYEDMFHLLVSTFSNLLRLLPKSVAPVGPDVLAGTHIDTSLLKSIDAWMSKQRNASSDVLTSLLSNVQPARWKRAIKLDDKLAAIMKQVNKIHDQISVPVEDYSSKEANHHQELGDMNLHSDSESMAQRDRIKSVIDNLLDDSNNIASSDIRKRSVGCSSTGDCADKTGTYESELDQSSHNVAALGHDDTALDDESLPVADQSNSEPEEDSNLSAPGALNDPVEEAARGEDASDEEQSPDVPASNGLEYAVVRQYARGVSERSMRDLEADSKTTNSSVAIPVAIVVPVAVLILILFGVFLELKFPGSIINSRRPDKGGDDDVIDFRVPTRGAYKSSVYTIEGASESIPNSDSQQARPSTGLKAPQAD